MTGRRPAAPPPSLPGFRYVELLGSGGFADVYLYEQQLPRRRVAVKVLLPDRLASGSTEQFTAEANVMAMLSTHPAIVTIYQAGVAEDGRPYLVMEYCPRPNLQVRYRSERFSVAEALRVGIQVAAAVETAHRAGVLHRDIKPANILVTEYNRPALTDFGIATTAGADEASAGMSIPWSPPESFGDSPDSGPRSDVYALGATVYTLLAGRSPFEVAGSRNTSAELIERIEREPLAALGRTDAPASLERVLQRSMAKNPVDRFESALAFARALQKVQIELAHSVTPIDILDDSPLDDIDEDEDDGLTRVRGVLSIDPETTPDLGPGQAAPRPPGPSAWAPTAPAAATADLELDHTVLRGSVAPRADGPPAGEIPRFEQASAEAPATVRRPVDLGPSSETEPILPPAPPASDGGQSSGRRRAGWIAAAVVAAVVVVGAAVGVATLVSGGEPADEPSAAPTSAPQNPIGTAVPRVADLEGETAGGDAVFTWTNPDPQDGDVFIWQPVALDGPGSPQRVEDTTVRVPIDASGRTCIEVSLVRADGRSSPEPTRGCVP